MKPVQRPKLTSPLERERGPSRSKSQAVPRPAAEWGVPAGGRSPCQGGLGAQPGTCGASQKFCPGQELAKGAAVGGQPGGHSGCNAHVLVAVGCCSGMAAALRGPPAPKAGGWFGISPPSPPAPGIRGASGSSETCRGVKDGGTYGCEGPGGHEPARLPSQVGKPGTWRGGRSPSSLVPALHRHLGAELCRSGPEQGWHRERTNPPVPGTAEPGTPPPPPPGSLQVQQSKGLSGAGWVRGSCLRLPGCAALRVREQSRGRCSAGLGGRRGLLRIFQSSLPQVGLSLHRAREKPCTAIARSSTNSLPSTQRGFLFPLGYP